MSGDHRIMLSVPKGRYRLAFGEEDIGPTEELEDEATG
ncbi:UNVERIFIED_ORG: hypothetical protein GGE64_006256 [Rhizobium etli]|nr:hypothetical protein [Rhizobium leguminosarum]